MYEEFPCRDDLGDLLIVDSENQLDIKKGTQNFEDQNYLLLTKDKAELVVQVYKTYKLYGLIRQVLSDKLRDMIVESLSQKPRTHFFIKSAPFRKLKPESDLLSDEFQPEKILYTRGAMSGFVQNMLKKAGVKKTKKKAQATLDMDPDAVFEDEDEDEAVNKGAINLLRHSMISEYYENIRKKLGREATAEERETIAKRFRHSPVTNESYVRVLKIDKLEEEALEFRAKDDDKPVEPRRSTRDRSETVKGKELKEAQKAVEKIAATSKASKAKPKAKSAFKKKKQK